MIRNKIAPYRRHLAACEHRDKGKDFTLCESPIWGYGYLNGEPWRRSLQTSDWPRALRRIEILLNGGELLPATSSGLPAVEKAIAAYLADAKRRKLAASTIRRNSKTLDHLRKFFAGRSIRAIDVSSLSAFCAGREVQPRTARKEIEHLRAFCAWCVERDWLEDNYAKKIKPPRVQDVATLPFTRDEVTRLLAACEKLHGMGKEDTPYVRQRARALILTLLYSGLRVSDVATLRRGALESSGHLVVRTTKTGVPVKVLLHPDAINALHALPAPAGNPT